MQHLQAALLAGLASAIAIALLNGLSNPHWPLLMAPFGASCVILFALPASPLARLRNVLGGHLLTSLAGMLILLMMGSNAFSLALATGLGVALMVLTRCVHPPAGANPLVILLAGKTLSWQYLLFPVLSGTLLLLVLAWAYRRSGLAQRV